MASFLQFWSSIHVFLDSQSKYYKSSNYLSFSRSRNHCHGRAVRLRERSGANLVLQQATSAQKHSSNDGQEQHPLASPSPSPTTALTDQLKLVQLRTPNLRRQLWWGGTSNMMWTNPIVGHTLATPNVLSKTVSSLNMNVSAHRKPNFGCEWSVTAPTSHPLPFNCSPRNPKPACEMDSSSRCSTSSLGRNPGALAVLVPTSGSCCLWCKSYKRLTKILQILQKRFCSTTVQTATRTFGDAEMYNCNKERFLHVTGLNLQNIRVVPVVYWR